MLLLRLLLILRRLNLLLLLLLLLVLLLLLLLFLLFLLLLLLFLLLLLLLFLLLLFLLLRSLPLVLPYLRPLLIFALPFYSHLLSLLGRRRSVALDSPGLLPFPMFTVLPRLPVPLKSALINPFVIPGVTVPGTAPVMLSPPRIYIIIKSRNSMIHNPASVIVV
jgi:Zn-dependent protease with chaperone function